jgi:hypothetical protein
MSLIRMHPLIQLPLGGLEPQVTDYGEYIGNFQDNIPLILAEGCQTHTIAHTLSIAKPNLELLCSLFGWVLIDHI